MKHFKQYILFILAIVSSMTIQAQDQLWAIGTAVPNGSKELVKMPNGNFKFAGTLQTGVLKIVTTPQITDVTKYLKPQYEDSYIVNNGLPYTITTVPDATDWVVTFPEDRYQFEVQVSTTFSGTLKGQIHQPWHDAYVAGGATDYGWSQFQMQSMIQDSTDLNIWTWTGPLRDHTALGYEEPRRIKIMGQLAWGPKSFHPYFQDQPIVGKQPMHYQGDDTKWTIAQDGIYQISINTLYETFEAKFVSADDKLYDVTSVKGVSSKIIISTDKPGTITIQAPGTRTMEVVTTQSHSIAKKSTNQLTVSGLESGMYIVKVGNQVSKVLVKGN